MNMTSDIDFACRVFLKLVSEKDERLEIGSRIREKMKASIAKGEEPSGYRADWLRESALEIIRTLGSQAQKFNTTYSSDKISAQDMVDALATAMNLLIKKIKED